MIRTVLFDIDGVWTDGSVLVDPRGREWKRIRYDDIDAYFELRRAGFRLGFLTGERGGFSRFVKRRFAPDVFLEGCKDKLAGYLRLADTHGWSDDEVCYVGDSRRDAPLLSRVGYGFAPRDGDAAARRAARRVLRARRGCGVVREAVDIVLRTRRA